MASESDLCQEWVGYIPMSDRCSGYIMDSHKKLLGVLGWDNVFDLGGVTKGHPYAAGYADLGPQWWF